MFLSNLVAIVIYNESIKFLPVVSLGLLLHLFVTWLRGYKVNSYLMALAIFGLCASITVIFSSSVFSPNVQPLSKELTASGIQRSIHIEPVFNGHIAPPSDGWFDSYKAEREFRDAPIGTIAFTPPPQMRVGESQTVKVRISRSQSRQVIQADLGPSQAVEFASKKVGHNMLVKLSGEGFEINPSGWIQQFVPDEEVAPWDFDVLPTKAGETRELTLEVKMAIWQNGSQEPPASIEVLHRTLRVDVNYWWSTQHFFAENWKWFLGGIGAVVLPAGGYFGKRWFERDRRQKARSHPAQARGIRPPNEPAIDDNDA